MCRGQSLIALNCLVINTGLCLSFSDTVSLAGVMVDYMVCPLTWAATVCVCVEGGGGGRSKNWLCEWGWREWVGVDASRKRVWCCQLAVLWVIVTSLVRTCSRGEVFRLWLWSLSLFTDSLVCLNYSHDTCSDQYILCLYVIKAYQWKDDFFHLFNLRIRTSS